MSDPRRKVWLAALLVACAAPAEDGGAGAPADVGKGDAPAANAVDVVSTALEIDYAARRARATIGLADERGTLALDVKGLAIDAVHGPEGELEVAVERGRLLVTDPPREIVVDYGFGVHRRADGLLPGGTTLLWPYHCGNLFPCDPAPANGVTFSLSMTGLPEGSVAVYAPSIPTEGPSYMFAFAVGRYGYQELGRTAAGTRVGVYWLEGSKLAALRGTRDLVKVFGWLEEHVGPYRFGSDVASVAARWGQGAYGGMEHHPYWHVSVDAMGDAETHAHEAAHGWYGDGVRIRCWEDFVLSEGTVSYLTARAIGQAVGAEAEAEVWAGYEQTLDEAIAEGDGVAWPQGCNRIDILRDGLFSNIPYMKGAFFFRAVAGAVGAGALDGVLSRFYLEHAGGAAGMQDLLAAIRTDTGFDPTELADAWLRSRGRPE